MLNRFSFFALIFLIIPTISNAETVFEEMDWDVLVPEDFRADAILEKYGDISEISDDDPIVATIMQDLEVAFKNAPVVESLDGKNIRIPGFVVPLEGEVNRVSEFLLVPYYGACIHVPPPPANQTIYVKVSFGEAEIRGLFDTVWVSGRLSAKVFDSDLATAGYQLEAVKVDPLD